MWEPLMGADVLRGVSASRERRRRWRVLRHPVSRSRKRDEPQGREQDATSLRGECGADRHGVEKPRIRPVIFPSGGADAKLLRKRERTQSSRATEGGAEPQERRRVGHPSAGCGAGPGNRDWARRWQAKGQVDGSHLLGSENSWTTKDLGGAVGNDGTPGRERRRPTSRYVDRLRCHSTLRKQRTSPRHEVHANAGCVSLARRYTLP